MWNVSYGAAQPNLSPQLIASLPVWIPLPGVQKRVVHILRSIDDLIENNRRRIEVLEQMAQAIYREWFVRFRYPGHEHATFVDSPLGPIPEGWSVTAVGMLAQIQSGFAFKSRDWQDDGVAVVKIQNVRSGKVDLSGCSFVSPRVADAAHKFHLRRGDVLITMTGEIGSIGVVRTDVAQGEKLAADTPLRKRHSNTLAGIPS